MILDKVSSVDSNISKSIDFKFSSNAAKLFAMLSNHLYIDKELAVIHELGANAYDAHKMVGKEHVPFTVVLPTILNPFLIVRDMGPGLSEEDVYKFLTTYGESDKQNSNELIGGWGIGSKSPAAVTQSWTISSHHENVEKVYLIVINEHGVPTLSKILERPTSITGLEVKIPTQVPFTAWEIAVSKAFTFYKVKPKVLNQRTQNILSPVELTMPFNNSGAVGYLLHKENDWAIAGAQGSKNIKKKYSVYGLKLIVNQREYDVNVESFLDKVNDDPKITSIITRVGVYMFFDTGDIDLSISRETLQLTNKTVSAITSKLHKIHDYFEENVRTKLTKAFDISKKEKTEYEGYMTILSLIDKDRDLAVAKIANFLIYGKVLSELKNPYGLISGGYGYQAFVESFSVKVKPDFNYRCIRLVYPKSKTGEVSFGHYHSIFNGYLSSNVSLTVEDENNKLDFKVTLRNLGKGKLELPIFIILDEKKYVDKLNFHWKNIHTFLKESPLKTMGEIKYGVVIKKDSSFLFNGSKVLKDLTIKLSDLPPVPSKVKEKKKINKTPSAFYIKSVGGRKLIRISTLDPAKKYGYIKVDKYTNIDYSKDLNILFNDLERRYDYRFIGVKDPSNLPSNVKSYKDIIEEVYPKKDMVSKLATNLLRNYYKPSVSFASILTRKMGITRSPIPPMKDSSIFMMLALHADNIHTKRPNFKRALNNLSELFGKENGWCIEIITGLCEVYAMQYTDIFRKAEREVDLVLSNLVEEIMSINNENRLMISSCSMIPQNNYSSEEVMDVVCFVLSII